MGGSLDMGSHRRGRIWKYRILVKMFTSQDIPADPRYAPIRGEGGIARKCSVCLHVIY